MKHGNLLRTAVRAPVVLALMVLALMVLALCGCQSKPITQQSFALDTFISFTVYGGTADDAQAALLRVDECEALLSAHAQGSDVERINASQKDQPVQVDALTMDVLQFALDVGEKTHGALDITLYDVSKLWDYKSENPSVPDEADIARALEHAGPQRIALEGDTVQSNGAHIDLGAVAKGAIGDEAAKTLSQRGVSCALLNLGGNIVTLGSKPDGTKWVVAIESPFEGQDYVGSIAFSGSKAVATSSGAQRYFVRDGTVYHHILDPKTGWPAHSGLASVTVLADEGRLADALSTALFVCGEESAEQILLNAYGAEVSAVLVRDDGTVRVIGELEFAPA